MNSNFFEAVYQIVAQIPSGRVMTYGQIAAMISTPRAARAVGWALRALPPDSKVPWQRVVGGDGRLTIINPLFPQSAQADRLRSEGVEVNEKQHTYSVELAKCLWRKI